MPCSSFSAGPNRSDFVGAPVNAALSDTGEVMPVLSLLHTSLSAITNLLRQKCDLWGFVVFCGQKPCSRNPKVHSSKGEERRQFCSMSWSRKPERPGKMQSPGRHNR